MRVSQRSMRDRRNRRYDMRSKKITLRRPSPPPPQGGTREAEGMRLCICADVAPATRTSHIASLSLM